MKPSKPGLRAGAVLLAALSGVAAPAVAATADQIHYVNPEAAARVCKSSYHGRDGSYQINLTDLGSHLYIEDRELSRGVTAHATIGEPDSGLLYIVSTRLRGDLGKDSSVLDRVEQRSQALAVRFPQTFSGKRGIGPFGRTFESTLINASKSGDETSPFPITVGYTPPRTADAIDSLAVHRHFVSQGYYYEIAVLLRNKGTASLTDSAELMAKAGARLDTAMASFTPGRVRACLSD